MLISPLKCTMPTAFPFFEYLYIILNNFMSLQYLTDYTGRHTAVVIPMEEWEGIVSRSPSRKSDAGNVYPYERVMTESGVEYHDASTNGRFQQAVNDMRQ